MHSFRGVLILASFFVFSIIVSAQGLDTAKIDRAIGKCGQKMGDVHFWGTPESVGAGIAAALKHISVK